MEKLKMHSPNLTQDNIARIRELFPGCVTEVEDDNPQITQMNTDSKTEEIICENRRNLRMKIDFDLLRQELSDSIVEGPQERYHLNWPGKREALLTANAPIARTLRPCREESVDFDTTKNLFIEGDNLDALKLLQETYLGKVKMIYIDPPYNTGSDLIYEDCFASDIDSYFKNSNQIDNQGNRLVANTDSNGRFHSDWLNMLYPRLKLSRPLLRDDGFIFISIGNDEVASLRRLCDEIFGEHNFIECISWNKRIPKNDKGIGNIHEFIVIYAKDATVPHELVMRKDGLDDIYELVGKLKKAKTPIPEAEKEVKKLYKKQGYDRGITLYNSFDDNYRLWGKINMSWPNANTFGPRYEVPHPITRKPVAIPDRGWRWKNETFWDAAKLNKEGEYESIIKLNDGSVMCGRIWFAKDEFTQPSSITYLDDVNTFLLRSILSLKSDGGIEVENLFEGKSYFSYPKPTSLLRILLSSLKLAEGDMILDYFAGASTTAHAIMQINAEDGINRRFIMIQLNEPCEEDTQAYKGGFKNIADISKERIRRAGKLVISNGCHSSWNKDIGFRVLKIDSSNMADVYYTPDAIEQGQLKIFTDNIKSGRKPEDLLFQVLLDWGVDLSLPIRREMIHPQIRQMDADSKSETNLRKSAQSADKHSFEVFFVDDNALVACFDTGVNEDLVKELARFEPLRVVFRDTGFISDAVKINVEQIFKQMSPGTEVKAI